MAEAARKPSLLESLIPIVLLIVLLFTNVVIFGDDVLGGSNQVALVFSAAVAALLGVRLGRKWDVILEGILYNINAAMTSILILLLIGALAGTWLLSGIVPAMIYYGLQILNPTIFLFAACLVCAITSLATGSSWSTVATIGIALLGVGKTLGISEGMVAGAIISGAYFGDKISPLSDTTNLASAMAGTELFTHIRYMLWTTIPSITLALLIFGVLGLTTNTEATINDVNLVMVAIEDIFHITGWLFVVPVVVIVLIVKKVPALPALFVGVVLGGLFAIIFQPQLVVQVAGDTGILLKDSYIAVMKATYGGVSITTDNELVSGLLSSGGMAGMLNTIWLIISAMVFGGVMEVCGFLQRITAEVIQFAKSTGSLVASTVGSCMFFNLTASDQYLAILVPGRMYAATYKERGLKPENLSRSLEDGGTVTSVLVPWNTCGATQAAVLGVATMTYLPFCFFNIISPFMSIIFAYLNIRIARYGKDEK